MSEGEDVLALMTSIATDMAMVATDMAATREMMQDIAARLGVVAETVDLGEDADDEGDTATAPQNVGVPLPHPDPQQNPQPDPQYGVAPAALTSEIVALHREITGGKPDIPNSLTVARATEWLGGLRPAVADLRARDTGDPEPVAAAIPRLRTKVAALTAVTGAEATAVLDAFRALPVLGGAELSGYDPSAWTARQRSQLEAYLDARLAMRVALA